MLNLKAQQSIMATILVYFLTSKMNVSLFSSIYLFILWILLRYLFEFAFPPWRGSI